MSPSMNPIQIDDFSYRSNRSKRGYCYDFLFKNAMLAIVAKGGLLRFSPVRGVMPIKKRVKRFFGHYYCHFLSGHGMIVAKDGFL